MSKIQTNYDALNKSPLFKLSLASKELFHSNFIAWLCENHWNSIREAFQKVYKNIPNDKPNEVLREKNNIDLTLVWNKNTKLIIENKIKSLPEKAQLDKYYEAEKKNKKNNYYILLSVTKPDFKPRNWKYMAYKKLIKNINNSIRDKYHKHLVEDYKEYMHNFVALLEKLSVDKIPKWILSTDISEKLKVLRIEDVVLKRRYAELKNKLKFTLEANDQKNELSSEIPKAQCMCNLKIPIVENNDNKAESFLVELQLQGNIFKVQLMLQGNNIVNEDRGKKIADQAVKDEFWEKFFKYVFKKREHDVPRKSNPWNKFFKKGKYHVMYRGVDIDNNKEVEDIVEIYKKSLKYLKQKEKKEYLKKLYNKHKH